jgi:hypothetical protein
MKPFRGIILQGQRNVFRRGFYYTGILDGHPQFHGKKGKGHTSFVLWEQPHHPNQQFDIETLNARYTVIPLDPNQG